MSKEDKQRTNTEEVKRWWDKGKKWKGTAREEEALIRLSWV